MNQDYRRSPFLSFQCKRVVSISDSVSAIGSCPFRRPLDDITSSSVYEASSVNEPTAPLPTTVEVIARFSSDRWVDKHAAAWVLKLSVVSTVLLTWSYLALFENWTTKEWVGVSIDLD